MHGWTYYQTKDLAVIPYMQGTPVFTDSMYPFLYNKTREEGKIEDTFCGDDLSLAQFIVFFEKLRTMQVLAEIKDDKTIVPVGYSWVATPRGVDGARAATCGFCFLSNASKRDSARKLAKMALAYVMIDMQVDVFHGIQLATNVAAKNFSRKVGFKEVGTVPEWHYSASRGELVGATVMILRAEEFVPKFEKWFAEERQK